MILWLIVQKLAA